MRTVLGLVVSALLACALLRGQSYFPWIQKMKQLGITTGCSPTTYCPDDPVTRGQMAVFIMHGEFNQLLPANSPVVLWVSTPSHK